MAGICSILGHPRSGTSFLHRFMLEHYSGLSGKRLEDMLFVPDWPRVLRPLRPVARLLPLSWVYRPEIHRTGMMCWECDDIAFSIHHRAGYLSWLYGTCRRSRTFTDADFDAWVSRCKASIFACWAGLYHRDLASSAGTFIMSKSFVMLLLLEEFLDRYPEAKVLIVTRSPAQVVGSTLSLVQSVCRRAMLCRHLRGKEIENIYHTIVLYYRRTADLLATANIADRILRIEYAELKDCFSDTCDRIADYLAAGSWDSAAVSSQAARQRCWQSKHDYDVGHFGISRERIAKDFPDA